MDKEETRSITLMASQWMLFDMLANSYGYEDANMLLGAIATGELTVMPDGHHDYAGGRFIPTFLSPDTSSDGNSPGPSNES